MRAVLAALPTAVLLFLSTSVPLYLNNQGELNHQTRVLAPFLIAFAATWIVGALCLLLSSRRVFRILSWAYLLLGPLLLLSLFTSPGIALVLVLAAFVFVLVRQQEPSAIFVPMALFGFVLMANEIVSFVTRLESRPRHAQWTITSDDVNTDLPNVYHVVLDELQTDAVELLPPRELGGMILLPNHSAVYHATVMSLGSMFTSSRYLYDRPRGEYIKTSFGEASFVTTLRKAGYRTMAVVPASDPLSSGVFEHVVLHEENFERGLAASTDTFEKLWLVANTPRGLLDRLMSSSWLDEQTRRELRLTMTGRGLTDAAPVASYLSFRELVKQEETLPARGRYTFVHLLIPHSPYVLGEDCSYRVGERATDPMAQTQCTLRVLGEFLDWLEALDRFEDSLILVHGDHGAPFRRVDDGLVPSRARSLRTPLLIKLPGRTRDDPQVSCLAEGTLIDLAPTLFDLVDMDEDASYEGVSLSPALSKCLESYERDPG